MAWISHAESVAGGRGLKIVIDSDSGPLAYADVLRHWRENAAFREYFGGLLEQAPFQAFRWETPPVSTATIDQAFECVVLDSPELDGEPDFQPFAKYFTAAARSCGVVEFQNLGKDAVGHTGGKI